MSEPDAWRVQFSLDDFDEIRVHEVRAVSYDDAIEIARRQRPWESAHATNILAWPMTIALYPDCGCRPETTGVINVVCRNPECYNYGTHRRGLPDDRCGWCGIPYTRLAHDPFKGAR